MPGDLGEPRGDYARVLHLNFAREAAGATRTRHSPRPLFEANGFVRLGRVAPRECGVVFDEYERATLRLVFARLDRATQYSRELMIKSRGRGVLDRPVKPDDDNFL
jgi:hypothetical protein